MSKYFDEQNWARALRHHAWYWRIRPEFEKLMDLASKSETKIADEIKGSVYRFFDKHLRAGKIALGKHGPDWDKERKPIDTIVIHHTSQPPGITWQYLSAMHLVRLYAGFYNTASRTKEPLRGQPIYSGHFRGKTQVFYAYHWLIRMDGQCVRLLKDDEIGWQAGDWNVNTRSIAICLDNDFEHFSPSKEVILTAARLIRKHYPLISPRRVIGHREVNPQTTCPGNAFLPEWKRKLRRLLT